MENFSLGLKLKPTPSDLTKGIENDVRDYISPIALNKCSLTETENFSNIKTAYTRQEETKLPKLESSSTQKDEMESSQRSRNKKLTLRHSASKTMLHSATNKKIFEPVAISGRSSIYKPVMVEETASGL